MTELEQALEELENLRKARVGAADWDTWHELGTQLKIKQEELKEIQLRALVTGELDGED